MDRLTKRVNGEAMHHDCHGTCGTCNGCECFEIGGMVDRLAAYEDTGLTPEEVAQMQEWWAQVPAIIESRVKRICEGEFTREEAQNTLHKHCCDCVHRNICGGEKMADDCTRYEPRNNPVEAEAALAEKGGA